MPLSSVRNDGQTDRRVTPIPRFDPQTSEEKMTFKSKRLPNDTTIALFDGSGALLLSTSSVTKELAPSDEPEVCSVWLIDIVRGEPSGCQRRLELFSGRYRGKRQFT